MKKPILVVMLKTLLVQSPLTRASFLKMRSQVGGDLSAKHEETTLRRFLFYNFLSFASWNS